MGYFLIVCLCLSLFGCSPSSLSDYRAEGEALCKTLIQDLQEIHDAQGLLQAAPKLKKNFEAMVEIMMAARVYQSEHSEEEVEPMDLMVQSELKGELERIYALEGGRETIEKAQQEALIRLSLFLKK